MIYCFRSGAVNLLVPLDGIFDGIHRLFFTLLFLAEEGILNMDSDFLLNWTPGVWIVESIKYFSLQNASKEQIKFLELFSDSWNYSTEK